MAFPQEDLDVLWDFDDPAGSEGRLAAAADEAGAEGLPEARAELLTQVARALGLQERSDEADDLLDALEDAGGAAAVRVPLERGRLRSSTGDRETAIGVLRTAADRAEAAGETFLLVDALHMLAITDEERAAEWTARALTVLDATTAPEATTAIDARTQRWRVGLHHNLAWSLLDAGATEDALVEFELALADAHRWGTVQQVVWAEHAIEEARTGLDRADG